jgi:hypothetical protein
MNKYIACAYGIEGNISYCLYRIENYEIIEFDENNEISYDYIGKFDIKDVLVKPNNMKFIQDDKGNYKWESPIYNNIYFRGLHTQLHDSNIAEFEDDEDALAWFKLNY